MSTNLYVFLFFFSPILILFFSFMFWIYREVKRREERERRRKWEKEWKEELWEIEQEELRNFKEKQ